MRRHEKIHFFEVFAKGQKSKDPKFEVETGTKDLGIVNYYRNDAL